MGKRITTEQFIEKAIEKHGDKYDYSKTNYINSYTKVEIYCKECKEYFSQLPKNYLKGNGCPKCVHVETGNKRTKTKERFIKDARFVHGDKYGYDKVVYVKCYIEVVIWCNIHKEYFKQTPSHHLSSVGCPKCGTIKQSKSITKTNEQFIIDARKVHGDLYGYDKVVYVNNTTRVDIYCKKHKKYFHQTPDSHLNGCGCQKCKSVTLSKYYTKTTKQFIKEAKQIHGNKYEYDKSVYIHSKTQIEIYCKKCKEYFFQIPDSHIYQKSGCPKCGVIKRSESHIKTQKQFIIDTKKKHGNKYGYDKVVYVNNTTKVEIYCKKHNKYFEQTPGSHLSGCGCPICNESRGEIKIRKYLEKNNIIVISQKRFVDCRNKYTLPFDFYLSDYNICIEFQGRQHYELVRFGVKMSNETMKNNYKIIQKNDKIKKDYCIKNNITLLEIPYWDIKNVDTILTAFINTCN